MKKRLIFDAFLLGIGVLLGFGGLKIAQDLGYGFFVKDNSAAIEKLEAELPSEVSEPLPLERFHKIANVRETAEIYLDAEDIKVILPNEDRKIARVIFKSRKPFEDISDTGIARVKTEVLQTFELPTDTPFQISDSNGILYLDDPNREDLEELAATTRHQRKIYFKLPLDGPRFHWRFHDRSLYLAGKLDLIITHPTEPSLVINVFENGSISEGWEPLSEPRDGSSPDSDSPIYFGFKSSRTFEVCLSDQVELRFECRHDLDGIGADLQGILKKGNYRSKGRFKLYFLKDGANDTAFLDLDEMAQKWPLKITAQTGWQADKAAE